MAEFLIKARDQVDLPANQEKRDRGWKRGDIVEIHPDGWEWGKEERLPKFVVVKIPGLPSEQARTKYMESDYRDTGLLDPDGRPIQKLHARRKFRVLMDNIPANIRNKLLRDGVVAVPWETVKSYIQNKITLQTE